MSYHEAKLGDVCSIDKTKKSTMGIPYVGMEDIETGTGRFLGQQEPAEVKSSTFQFTDQHILYGRLRPYLNKVMIPDFMGHCSSEIFPLLPSDKLDRQFLFYWFNLPSVIDEINRTCTGARMPRANMKEVIGFEIPLPPLDEQKRIVAILDKAFAGIDQAIANTEKNIQNAKELFESILDQTLNRKDPSLANTTLGEACEFFNGKAHEKSIDEDGKYVVVNSKFVSTEGAVIKRTNQQMFPLVRNDIAMVMSDVPKGKALAKCYIVEDDGIYSLNQRICCIKSENFLTEYLYFQLNRHPYLLAFDNKGSQANLRKADILSCPLYMPAIQEQEAILNKLSHAKESARNLEGVQQEKLAALKELKQSLLQKAFAGELTSDMQEVA